MMAAVRWREVHDALEREIGEGVYPQGARLPVEDTLAERFGVHRHTVRRAVAALAQRGILTVQQGRGTFVRRGAVDYRVGRKTRFTEIVTGQQRSPTRRLLRAVEMPADAATAAALGLGAGAACFMLETLDEVDGVPIGLCSHHFPVARVPGLIDAYIETGSITGALERHGLGDYERRRTSVTARMPTAEEAALLRQPRDQPVLLIESLNVDPAGAPLEYGVARSVAERVKMVFET
ncbi:phosphonate metabolism transcriptional regulator PhnF [Allostella vacuolata]|nr:phosphonate metabolism transcriptional regulator PhnF [Stella vacuolata]